MRVPDGKKLDKLELYLNETRVATLYDPPFVQTVDIPANEGVGYLRAVATFKDDPTPPVEDVVMINTPQYMEEVNVHLVELPTTVMRNGHPVNDLPEAAFKVLDEGKPVKIAKFEHVNNLPLSIGMAIDTSGSMQPRMTEAQKAGAQFFQNVMRKGDKAFLVVVRHAAAARAEVVAAARRRERRPGQTARRGVDRALRRRRLLALQLPRREGTEGAGRDHRRQRHRVEVHLRSGARIRAPRRRADLRASASASARRKSTSRYKLGRFCTETGGNVYYIDNATDLRRIYADIQNELRSQYVLGFYPPEGIKPGSKWREVNVQVSEGKAKTIRGYYP